MHKGKLLEFVLEIKYKRDKLDPGNFYQALAYSLTLNCPVMLFLPIFEQKKMGDFKVKPLPEHPHNISVRTIDFSPHENYIDECIIEIKKIMEKNHLNYNIFHSRGYILFSLTIY